MREKYITGTMLNLDQMLKDVDATIEGFNQDIARVDSHMRYEDHKLDKHVDQHNEAMRRLKADRRQRVKDLAAFRESVRDEWSSIEAAMVQRRNEQQGSPVHCKAKLALVSSTESFHYGHCPSPTLSNIHDCQRNRP